MKSLTCYTLAKRGFKTEWKRSEEELWLEATVGEEVPPPGQSKAPLWCCRWCSPSAPSVPPCQPEASQAELKTHKHIGSEMWQLNTYWYKSIVHLFLCIHSLCKNWICLVDSSVSWELLLLSSSNRAAHQESHSHYVYTTVLLYFHATYNWSDAGQEL